MYVEIKFFSSKNLINYIYNYQKSKQKLIYKNVVIKLQAI